MTKYISQRPAPLSRWPATELSGDRKPDGPATRRGKLDQGPMAVFLSVSYDEPCVYTRSVAGSKPNASQKAMAVMPAMNTLMNVSGGGRRNGIGRTAIAALAIAVAGMSVPGHAQSSKGAGSTASEPSRMTRSGFLSNYAKLKPGESGIHCWRDAAIDLKQYDKILIANIVVSLKTDPTKPIDPTDLKTLVDYFHGALVAAMKPQLEVVTQPAPGVLVVRTALTNLVPTSSVKSLAGTATPFGFVAEGAAGAASGRPVGSTPYLGETGVEMQFLDGASGTILAECADAQVGRKYAAEMDKGAANAAKTWASGYMNSFQAWAYAKEAFDKWSGLLAKRLADLRGVTVAKK